MSSIMKETDRRFVSLEKKVGLFVLIAAVCIGLLVVFIGLQRDLFVAKARIYTIADSGKDIVEGMAVKLSGFKIGKVKNLHLDDITQVKLELLINRDYMKWIKVDSTVILVKEGMIGDAIIEVQPGSDGAMPIEERGTISFEREQSLNELADEVKAEVMILIYEIRDIIDYINDPEADIKRTLHNVNQLSADLLVTRGKLDDLFQNTDRNIGRSLGNLDKVRDAMAGTLGEMEQILRRVDPLMDSAGNSLSEVEENLPGIMGNVNESLENLQQISEDLKRVADETLPHVPGTMSKGEEVLDDAAEITDSVKKTWPINKNIKTPKEKVLNVDSYE